MGRRDNKGPDSETQASRTWDPRDWEEHPRFVAALEALGRGLRREALSELSALVRDEPTHAYGRSQLVAVALELEDVEVLAEHVEWALSYHAEQGAAEAVVATYGGARRLLPELAWSEKTLLIALRMAERLKDNRAVLDVAKQLLIRHPLSRALPRALLVSADAQLREGRPGLARATLQSLLARYPLDPLVPHAERKLLEVERQLGEMKQRHAQEEHEEQQLLLARRERIERQVQRTQERELERSEKPPEPPRPAQEPYFVDEQELAVPPWPEAEQVADDPGAGEQADPAPRRYEMKPISLHPLSADEVERLLYGAPPGDDRE
jgi:hypothetical protein